MELKLINVCNIFLDKKVRWPKEDVDKFNSIHTDSSQMPTPTVFAQLCEAFPDRPKKALRTRASNIKLSKLKR